ncbi:DUF1622 domain-containing protein [Geminocystis sp. GBBB08]|uniref:DUF1622 domain-containing protein n=1 Tax=Geminocystis sp. GBBB08 TaxID=2604140 RepID=UPI0027E2BA1A|nr:DUF1622 domain-containing protein [Geminocystis sp. GBBB08]
MMENLESTLGILVTFLKFLLEAIAVFCILLGILKTGQLAYMSKYDRNKNLFTEIRLEFGMWLVLALEFQLGADIVSTSISSTFDSLGKLGMVALIRTFLNYFLTKELESQRNTKEK